MYALLSLLAVAIISLLIYMCFEPDITFAFMVAIVSNEVCWHWDICIAH